MSGTLREPRGVLLRMMIQCFFFFFSWSYCETEIEDCFAKICQANVFFFRNLRDLRLQQAKIELPNNKRIGFTPNIASLTANIKIYLYKKTQKQIRGAKLVIWRRNMVIFTN